MSRRPRDRQLVVPSAAVLAVLLLGGCTGGSDATPGRPGPQGAGDATSTAPGGAGGAGGATTTSEVAETVLEEAVDAAEPGAGTEGAVGAGVVSERTGASSPATAEVVSVTASPASTVLTWRLTAESSVDPLAGDNAYGDGAMTGVLLADVAAGQVLAPNTYVQVGPEGSEQTRCVCSAIPFEVGPEPLWLSGEYPPLAEGTQEVEVRIAGFEPVTAPVERVER